MKCEYCDNEVPAGATRCPSCGATVKAEPAASVSGQASGQGVPVQVVINNAAPAGQALSTKKRIVYQLLAFFLGALGVHNFYSGHTGRGIVKLLVTIFTFGYLGWAMWIWAFVELCIVKQDSAGNLMA